MNMLSLSALSVGAALICTSVPLSFHWSPVNELSISIDQAQAQDRGTRRIQRRTPGRTAAGVAAAGAVAAGAVAAGAVLGGPGPYYGPGPAPAYGPGNVVVPPGAGATVVNPVTGRWCRIEPSGWRWCWTP
jgi:hypothetical protein